MDIQTVRRAAMHLRWASELLTKHATLAEAQADTNGIIAQAEDNLRIGTELCDFDLVKRMTAREAHDRMLAARLAETPPEEADDPPGVARCGLGAGADDEDMMWGR